MDRALVTGMGDGATQEPQRYFGGQGRKLRGRECDRTAYRPRTGSERGARGGNGEFDRRVGAAYAGGQARETARIESFFASAGMKSRNRARVKRRSRLVGSSL